MISRILVSIALVTPLFVTGQTKSKTTTVKDQFVESLIKRMTIEEKIGQLNLPSAGDIVTGAAKNADIATKIKSGQVGGLFNIKSVAKIKEIQNIAVKESRLKIPLLFGMDVIHGYETTFPIPLGVSATFNLDAIERSARIAAIEASADGINWTFSPMVDISRDPRWGRISEGSGEDPYLGSKIAEAMIRGYQGTNLSDPKTILACVKHFALYGAPEAGRDYNTVDMSRIRMYNDYFPPYKAAIDAGVASVMASFNEVDGIPATGNKWLMTDVLRNQWKFNGFVVTDYTGINEMIDHGMGDLQNVSALALKAGIHMDMVGEGFIKTLKKSLDEGRITIEQINEAVRLILNAKYDLGLFDDPFRYCNEKRTKTDIYTPEHRAEAVKIAEESFVLLKNEKQLLPLQKSQKIALVGPLANNAVNMAGTWSVATKQERSITVIDGLKAFGITDIRYAKGSNLDHDSAFEERATMFGKSLGRDNRTAQELLNEAMEVCKNADVIVAAIGESAEMSGESSSRSNLEIPSAQKELLRELKKLNKPIVVVLFTGRPLVLNEELELADAVLNVWFPGSEAGTAIANSLYGKSNPSGKITATFPRNVGQVPIYYAAKNTGRPLGNTEGKFEKFRSNYIDVRNEPLFPFGFGLSYTTFSYSNINANKVNFKAGEEVEVRITLQNTGKYAGAEVVQLYVRDLVGSVTRPLRELKGFQKVFLEPGESKTIAFTISEEDLKFYNSDLNFVAEPGEFEVYIGGNSNATDKVKINLLP